MHSGGVGQCWTEGRIYHFGYIDENPIVLRSKSTLSLVLALRNQRSKLLVIDAVETGAMAVRDIISNCVLVLMNLAYRTHAGSAH